MASASMPPVLTLALALANPNPNPHPNLYGQRQYAAGARAGDHLEELTDAAARAPLELLEHLQREGQGHGLGQGQGHHE